MKSTTKKTTGLCPSMSIIFTGGLVPCRPLGRFTDARPSQLYASEGVEDLTMVYMICHEQKRKKEYAILEERTSQLWRITKTSASKLHGDLQLYDN